MKAHMNIIINVQTCLRMQMSASYKNYELPYKFYRPSEKITSEKRSR